MNEVDDLHHQLAGQSESILQLEAEHSRLSYENDGHITLISNLSVEIEKLMKQLDRAKVAIVCIDLSSFKAMDFLYL